MDQTEEVERAEQMNQTERTINENSETKVANGEGDSKSWYELKESRSAIGYSLMLFMLRFFPPFLMRLLTFPIGFGYYVFSPAARKFSKEYFSILSAFVKKQSGKNFKGNTFFHLISFALALVEMTQTLAGKFSFEKNVFWQNDDVKDLVEKIDNSKGAILLISHLGNAQMLRGLAGENQAGTKRQMQITTISDVKITAGFNALLRKINPELFSSFTSINTDEIGPETIFVLQDKLEKGEIIVIAGDRVSAVTDRNISIPFLGKNASFPYGVFLLIALLDFPTYFVFGTRQKDVSVKPRYDMFVVKNKISFKADEKNGNGEIGKKERAKRIIQTAESFARELEKHCVDHPYQWYNFYDFWK